MKIRIALTAVLVVLFVIANYALHLVYSPLTGAATAAQFNDTVASYAAASFLRDGTFIRGCYLLFFALLAWLWAKPLIAFVRHNPWNTAVAALLLATSSCTPYKTLDVVEVKPNETAWAIPLDAMSNSGQVKFNSVDFLNQKKIPSKRIMVDKVPYSTGRMWYDLDWIPATRVITVDRSLVTREWVDITNGRKDGVGVVTKDQVKLRVGLTITASIDEDDASTYLYYHGSTPGKEEEKCWHGRALSDVLDQNIRSFAVAELTREYSLLNLSDAKTHGDAIYSKLFADAGKAFKAKGVTIQYLGNAEGLTFDDPKVQDAINKSYLAQQDAITAQQEQDAQRVRNTTLVMNAQTEADAAKKLFDAKEASTFKNDLNIRLISAQAQMEMAKKWSGAMPTSILPSNSPMLMNFGSSKP